MFALLLIVFVIFGLFSSTVFGAIPYQNTGSDTQITTYHSSQRRYIQSLGTGLTSSFSAFEFSFKSSSSTNVAGIQPLLFECPTSYLDWDLGSPTLCAVYEPANTAHSNTVASYTVTPYDSKQILTADFTDYTRADDIYGTNLAYYDIENTPIVFNASKYYFLFMAIKQGTTAGYFYGSTSSGYSGGICYQDTYSIPTNLVACSNSVADLYFAVYDSVGAIVLQYPYVPLSPLEDEQVPNNFGFVGKINNQGGAYSFKLKVWGVTDTNYSHEKTFIIPSSSAVNISYSQVWDFLPDGDYEYTWRFCDDVGLCTPYWSDYLSTPKIQFEVLEGATSPFPVQDFVECGTFEMFCHLKNWSIWLFGVSDSTLYKFSTLTLENSLPFSYIYDVDDLYDDLFGQTSATLGITFTTPAWGTVTLLSADMIDDVPFQDTLYTIISAILIFFTAMTLYRKIIRVHDSSSA